MTAGPGRASGDSAGRGIALPGDYHVHTVWSDGAGTVEECVLAAVAAGLPEIGIADHLSAQQPSPWAMPTIPLAQLDRRRAIGLGGHGRVLERRFAAAAGVGQRPAQQPLDVGVDAAQVVRRPGGERVVHRGVEPQQQALAFSHRVDSPATFRALPSVVQGAGVDDGLRVLLAAEDD